jgi:hypothetical protein
MSSIRRLIAAILCIGITGCTIYRDEPYFAPIAAPGIKIINTFRGLPEVVQLVSDKRAEIRLIVFPKVVRCMLYLSDGDSIQLHSDELIMTALPDGKNVKLKIQNIEAQEVVDGRGRLTYISPKTRLQGQTYTYGKETIFGGGSMRRQFMIDVAIPDTTPNHFTLQLPPMSRSGVPLQFHPIEFRLAVGSAYQGSPP